ncbi:hypothetical protein SCAR479_09702 [Seiridium cardinale]|uniref:Uncharacterized protein n=1 Tax=Seiridium cardinale TaxID=138064 RepID=A0ABR2XIB0_9PEZI
MQLKPQPIGFRFINTAHPSDATTPSSLSQIRSHAAKDNRARAQRSRQPTLKSDKKPKNRSRRRNQVASAVTDGVENNAVSREQQGLETIAPFRNQFAALSHGGLPARPLFLCQDISYLILFRNGSCHQAGSAPSQPRVGGNSKAWFTSMQLKCWLPFALADIGLLTSLFLSSCRSLEMMTEFQNYTGMYATYKHQCIRSTNESLSFEKTRVSDTTIAMVMVLVSESIAADLWALELMMRSDIDTA